MSKKITSVFLVDDDDDDCFLFQEALKDIYPSTNLTILHDGEQLMTMLNLVPPNFPDVIFLDLNMPRKNGFECLSEIKKSKMFQHLKVIIFSTCLEKNISDQLYKDGADCFIGKPANFDDLKIAIQHAFESVLGKVSTPIS